MPRRNRRRKPATKKRPSRRHIASRKPRCPVNGKRVYRTEQDALAEIEAMAHRARPGHPVPVRAYTCEHCGEWHLTHKAVPRR